MSAFRDRLAEANPDGRDWRGRRWIFVAYDQLTDAVGPLSAEDPDALGVILVETTWKPRQRRYHKQKLALLLANLRHFALEQAGRGVLVKHVAGEDDYATLLRPLAEARGPLRMMEAAERELRMNLAPLVDEGLIEVVPNETWLTRREQFESVFAGDKSWRMDRFYREVRREAGVLMDGDEPEGGQWSFDADNRKRWRGEPKAPEIPSFPVDDVKQEVVALVEDAFGDHPGRLDGTQLPATREDARALWRWAKKACLPHFGPYEDAMSTESRNLFHTRVSSLVNLGRLLPRDLVADVEGLDVPIQCREGFIRQVIGWREFMRHVHVATDGFRELEGLDAEKPSFLDAHDPLPEAFWGEASGLDCLDRVVEDVWETGYGHHITRLMVLSNLTTLLSIEPREVSDWFWVAYVDAYDWVVEPNVLGMGTYALGDLFVTKPYVSGANYIDKMSDYCGACAFSPKKDCPITSLYWDFMRRQADRLADNPRVAMPLRSLEKRDASKKEEDEAVADWIRRTLQDGEVARPEDRP